MAVHSPVSERHCRVNTATPAASLNSGRRLGSRLAGLLSTASGTSIADRLPNALAGRRHVQAFDPERRERIDDGVDEGGLYETGTFAPDDNTYPNGCHVCEVEIDPDTGALEIVRYVVVDDVGTVVNPIGLKGQIHGGVAQGLGQAVMERVVYDRESGQNLTGSFMDYCMPRADTMPPMEITSSPVPTKRNPLGAKGAGEAGTVGALPAIVNAVVDALAPLGVKGLDMPATSERIWEAIRNARA